MTHEQASARIAQEFGLATVAAGTPSALTVVVPADRWQAFAAFAQRALGCGFFAFLTAIDWKEEGLDIVVRVENLDAGFSLTMKTRLVGGVACASLVPIYRGADWMERECFDMFGVRFEGHPDLRRILLGDDWVGHPLLKSYAVDTPHPPYR